MLTIKIGKITKHVNSTKRTYTTVGTHEVCLKEGSSIEEPVFLLNSSISYSRLSRCNYVEWLPDAQETMYQHNNYYWITGRRLVHNNLIEISCRRDVLATFKSSICNYDGFIARGTRNIDTMITDPNILSKPVLINEISKSFEMEDLYTKENIFSWKDGEISYTWTTIGINGCSIFNTPSPPNTTMYEILYLQGGTIWQNFEWGVTNPGQYVKDCVLLPFVFQASDYGLHKIYIGNLTADITDAYVWEGEASSGGSWASDSPDRFYQRRMTIDLSSLSLAYPANDFRNYDDNFTNIRARIPYIGLITIPAKHLKANDLYLSYQVSAMTGKGKAQLLARYMNEQETGYNLVNIGTYNIETGIPVAVAAGHTNMLQQARDVIEGVKTAGDVLGTITKPTPAGVVNSTANVMSTALETAAHAAAGYQEYTVFGSNGSLMETFNEYNKVYVYLQQYESTSTDFSSERGRPVYKKQACGTSAQYVQWLSPSLKPAGATGNEISELNAYMASGIYIETEEA